MDFERVLDGIKSIKLTGGMFGKTSLLVIVLSISMAAVSIKIGTWWGAMLLMLPVAAIALYALKRCFDFAEKNPQAAIMDGAELLIHEQLIHEKKGNIIVGQLETTTDHPQPQIDRAEVEKLDAPPQPSLPSDAEND